MKIIFILLLFFILTAIGPLWIYISGQINFDADYRTANRAGAHIAPNPTVTKEAVIQAYKARAFNWRGLFSVHTWIAIKKKNASYYTVYQAVGWHSLYNMPILMPERDLPDRYWFDQKPQLILDMRGEKAEKLIPQIETATRDYPYPNEYTVWPGPNSNTYPAYIARQVPELGLLMPANAIGKDFLPGLTFFARTPSGTGYQFSLFGLLGITLALREGFELNLLGFVYGANPLALGITLPGIGAINLIQN